MGLWHVGFFWAVRRFLGSMALFGQYSPFWAVHIGPFWVVCSPLGNMALFWAACLFFGQYGPFWAVWPFLSNRPF